MLFWGRRKSSENVSDKVVLETVKVKDDNAYSIEHTKDNDGESDRVVVEMINFF